GQVTIYRAMRELPAHVDTKMASVMLRAALDELTLTPCGLVTPADEERRALHQERVARLEAALGVAREAPAEYVAAVDERLFDLAEQAAEQQRLLQVRAQQKDWRMIVDRYGLTPENVHFLVGVPIPHDTIILVHRTVWQAFIYYRFVMGCKGGLTAHGIARVLERKFGFHADMLRAALYLMPGRVPTPVEVVGQFLNLLVDAGYLRNERRSEHFHYHPPEAPVPPLAFADRKQRHAAWDGLLSGTLRRDGLTLLGKGGPIPLAEAAVEDHWAGRRWPR
ncbi:MAG TPA: hypothetical protein VNT75_21870, partial [Symbiobacteriaceae bacterium]|nr:hypothetical protein [Symbiobacteriaceae bacterium]